MKKMTMTWSELDQHVEESRKLVLLPMDDDAPIVRQERVERHVPEISWCLVTISPAR